MEQSSQLPPHLTLLKREEGREIPRSTSEINDRSMRAYNEQYWYGENFLADYIGLADYVGKKILEVGPAEAGLLKFLNEQGANCTGMELSPLRFSHSELLLSDNSEIKLEKGDICNSDSYLETLTEKFDVIIIRDVIEHIEDKLAALRNMFDLLSNEGRLFISFPPRYCAYAGHQQTVKSIFGKIPYLHLLSNTFYSAYLRMLGHPETGIDYLMATKMTRVSVRKMERLFSEAGYKIEKRGLFFFRPAYRFRFHLPTLKNPLSWLFGFRELLTNGALYVLEKRTNN
jgi:2-polyprenyl-3-methyl-5-hydroxy-6-metoxy-1,4-benzoquinol methylase